MIRRIGIGVVLLLLTAGHYEAEFRRLAVDYAVRKVGARTLPRLRGSIIVLERLRV